jgi:hypothetical protein
MNAEGLTNKQLLIEVLERLLAEVESGLVAQQTLERARVALAEVKRPRKPAKP